MASSSPTPKSQGPTPAATDPQLQLLQRIGDSLDSLLKHQASQDQQLRGLSQQLIEISQLVDGFTSSGSSFRSYQLDPMVIAYAAILGPILGDRIDASVDKGEGYVDDMLKGAAVMARKLLRVLDAYLSERGGLDYLESLAGDIQDPGSPAGA